MKTTALPLLLLISTAGLLPAQSSPAYLALGDSVPFGMNLTLVPPYSTQIPTASEFIGYPEVLAAFERLTEINAACPGETSGSFLDISMPDNGCNSPHVIPPATAGYPPITLPPFKPTVGLHTPYTESQMQFAISQLQKNKTIRLVTLSIGANDVLLALPQIEAQCGTNPACAQGVLTPILQSFAGNLTQILTQIRSNYKGTLIVMTYYSPAPALDSITQALNTVMTQTVAAFPSRPGVPAIKIADGYTAFHVLTFFTHDDACQAGLLIRLPPNPYDSSACDVHPSETGRSVLAIAAELAQAGH